MKNVFCCLILFLTAFSSNINAQQTTIKVNWGPEQKEPGRSTITDIIGFDDEYFYTLRTQYQMFSKGVYVESFDKKHKLVNSLEVDLKKGDQKLDFEFVILFGGELYVFGSAYNNNIKKAILYSQKLNKKSLRPAGETIKIAEASGSSRYKVGTFNYTLSRRKTVLAITANQVYTKNEPEELDVVVLSSNLEQLWSKKIKIAYNDRLFSFKDYEVDENGNFYLLGKIYFQKVKEIKQGEPNYSHSIFAYLSQGADVKEYKVQLDEKFITDMNFEISNSNDIVCAGFYSEKSTYSIIGTYFLSIDPISKAVKSKGIKKFDTDFMSKFMSEKKAAKGNRELYNYNIDRMILREDGGALILAESFRVYTTTSYSNLVGGGRRETVTYHYVYGNIIAININPDNSIDWIKKIPKYQHTVNDGGSFSSFADMVNKDRIYLIYNDSPDNLTITDPKRIKTYTRKKSVVTLVIIKPNGDFTKKLLFDNNDQDIVTRPKACEQISDNTMLIYGEKRKTFRLGSLIISN